MRICKCQGHTILPKMNFYSVTNKKKKNCVTISQMNFSRNKRKFLENQKKEHLINSIPEQRPKTDCLQYKLDVILTDNGQCNMNKFLNRN